MKISNLFALLIISSTLAPTISLASIGDSYELSGGMIAEDMSIPHGTPAGAFAAGQGFCSMRADEKKVKFVSVQLGPIGVTEDEGPDKGFVVDRVVCIFKK